MKADFKRSTKRLSAFDIVFFAVLVLSAAGKVSAALRLAINSDNSLPALVYYDLVKDHNFTLRLWNFAVNSFLFTDLPVYLALGPVLGMGALTLKIGALILFALSIILMSCVAYRIFDARTALYCAGFLLAASPFFSSFALRSFDGSRVGTIIFSLAAYLAVDSMIRAKGRARGWRGAVFPLSVVFMATSLAVFSDPYALLFVAAGAAAYLGMRVFRRSRLLDRGVEAALIVTVAAALMTVKLLYAAAGPLDITFLRHLVPFGFTDAKDASGYFLYYCRLCAGLFNMDALEKGLPWYETALRASNALLFAAVSAGASILTVKEKDDRKGFALLFFCGVWVLASLAFIFKQEVVLDMQQARYLAPLLYPVSIFFALCVGGGGGEGRLPWKCRALMLALFFLSALYSAGTGFQQKPGYKPDEARIRLSRFLEQNGLSYGYADYWNADVLTLLSNDAVKVRSLSYKAKSNEFKLYVLNAKLDGYKPSRYEGRTFLIVAKSGQSSDFDRLYSARETITRFFGRPEEVLQFEDKYIYVWPHNIVVKFWPSPPPEKSDARHAKGAPEGLK